MSVRISLAGICALALVTTMAHADGQPAPAAPGAAAPGGAPATTLGGATPGPPSAQSPSDAALIEQLATTPGKSVTTDLYTVKDGTKVDDKTLQGWKTWRAMACERCHGPSQEGLVGPPLVLSLRVLTKDQFHTTIMEGRIQKGMPPFSSVNMVNQNWEGLYAYLKGRSNGDIAAGHLYALASNAKSAQNSK